MAQQQHPYRKPSPHQRESDLQPVYDVLNALQPSHLRAVWHRTDRRARWMMILLVAGVILLWSVLRISIMVATHIQETSGPFLWEALRAPYNLEARLIPTIDLDADPATMTLLPTTVGEFTLQPETAVTDEETPVEEAAAEEPPAVVYPISDCLYAGGTSADKEACVHAEPQFIESGDYQNAEGASIRVTAAMFASDYEATQVTKDLHRFAFSIGSVGNFVLDLGPVDYFYSSISEQYTFVWSQGNWVYTASGPVFDDLETLVKSFPY